LRFDLVAIVVSSCSGNFRDPSRAVQLSDSHYYLAVGSDDGNATGHGSVYKLHDPPTILILIIKNIPVMPAYK
jgi:hypothetical protein